MNGLADKQLHTRIKPQFYLDSVALMRMSRELTTQPGVVDAAMMMGTPANIEIMSNAGLLQLPMADDVEPGPGDLVLSVLAHSDAQAGEALLFAEQLLVQPQQSRSASVWQPRSIARAVVEHPDASLALISVPGAFAVSEARKAIRRGLHAMIFSDNVPLEDELALKQEASELGLLVMGPDCGTCIINGVPLAFANKLPGGNIGIVGASGTGIQEISCLLAHQGLGVSHAIGVGGRDMSAGVGGLSTLMALDALHSDSATKHIVVICKPPAREVAERVLQRIADSKKTHTLCFIGGEQPDLPANVQWADTLHEAARLAALSSATARPMAVVSMPDDVLPVAATGAGGPLIRGLFCGGTLCAEAQVIGLSQGLAVSSNAAIPSVDAAGQHDRHSFIDLGADEYTQGKPHPMIDPAVRDQLIREALSDKRTGVVLLDVVIGYGAHADPAGQLADSLPEDWADSGIRIIASVTGTDADPQVRSRQIARLQQAGIDVVASNAEAAMRAVASVKGAFA
ncbi:MAG: acyl-CoA synthetase FdrA [Granulosicoccus sp.]